MKSFNFYFELINKYYGKQTTKRSEVPLIAHIVEGVNVLKFINASDAAIRAYMIHPIFQDNSIVETNLKKYGHAIDPYVLGLTLEYRKTANNYLSKRIVKSISEIELSVFKEVNDMLIADKVQNYKDFLVYHEGKHERSFELSIYFQNWLERLSIDFEKLVKSCYDTAVTVKINKKGKTLLLNRYNTDKTYVGQCHPGGKLEIGETLIEGLKREVKEELNWDLTYDNSQPCLDWAKLYYMDCFLCETKKGLKSVFTYELNLNDSLLWGRYTEFDFIQNVNKNEFESCEWVDKESWDKFWNSDVIDYENHMFYAVDYDNTIAPDAYPEIGEPTVEAIEGLTKILSNPTNHVIIYTMRNYEQREAIVKKLKSLGLRILGHNEHALQHEWTDSQKVYADYFIDDRNVGTPLIGKMVDWSKLNL